MRISHQQDKKTDFFAAIVVTDSNLFKIFWYFPLLSFWKPARDLTAFWGGFKTASGKKEKKSMKFASVLGDGEAVWMRCVI